MGCLMGGWAVRSTHIPWKGPPRCARLGDIRAHSTGNVPRTENYRTLLAGKDKGFRICTRPVYSNPVQKRKEDGLPWAPTASSPLSPKSVAKKPSFQRLVFVFVLHPTGGCVTSSGGGKDDKYSRFLTIRHNLLPSSQGYITSAGATIPCHGAHGPFLNPESAVKLPT
ncbi:hypothetical protein BGY98DRAFT_52723 [Russula aff. rugulosa BPL654]|nr:hypothetical protein BGY98DRAFT_52723 [Russula aff. rugulosa BPL654]